MYLTYTVDMISTNKGSDFKTLIKHVHFFVQICELHIKSATVPFPLCWVCSFPSRLSELEVLSSG